VNGIILREAIGKHDARLSCVAAVGVCGVSEEYAMLFIRPNRREDRWLDKGSIKI
jgi:hypothetical protein